MKEPANDITFSNASYRSALPLSPQHELIYSLYILICQTYPISYSAELCNLIKNTRNITVGGMSCTLCALFNAWQSSSVRNSTLVLGHWKAFKLQTTRSAKSLIEKCWETDVVFVWCGFIRLYTLMQMLPPHYDGSGTIDSFVVVLVCSVSHRYVRLDLWWRQAEMDNIIHSRGVERTARWH